LPAIASHYNAEVRAAVDSLDRSSDDLRDRHAALNFQRSPPAQRRLGIQSGAFGEAMTAALKNGKQRGSRQARASLGPRADLARESDVLLHSLKNTLASLRLRLGVLAADPTCRWAQEENLSALLRIADEAMGMAGQVRESWHAPAKAEARPSALPGALPRNGVKRPARRRQ
jgi:hypothetical protein